MGKAPAGRDNKNRRKQPSRLRPKNAIRKSKTNDKPKDKKKDKKRNRKKFTGDKKIKSNDKKNNNTKIELAPAVKKKKKEIIFVQWANVLQQRSFFVNQYESANRVRLSSLELDSLPETCMLELCQSPAQNQNTTGNLGEHVKVAFGSSWKEVLCGKYLKQGKVDTGSPALLVISASALRSLDFLRELRNLTQDCHPAKLFSKHMKVEEQVSMLENRVNIATGTPNRIKKLIDMEVLKLSRLAVIVFDMHTDVKGYSLFSLPQVRDEFWDLYKAYFHQPWLEGKLRFCLYGPVPINLDETKSETSDD
ncbi:hypothetical protein ACP275_14G041400 [Erythranthe tilingii]